MSLHGVALAVLIWSSGASAAEPGLLTRLTGQVATLRSTVVSALSPSRWWFVSDSGDAGAFEVSPGLFTRDGGGSFDSHAGLYGWEIDRQDENRLKLLLSEQRVRVWLRGDLQLQWELHQIASPEYDPALGVALAVQLRF